MNRRNFFSRMTAALAVPVLAVIGKAPTGAKPLGVKYQWDVAAELTLASTAHSTKGNIAITHEVARPLTEQEIAAIVQRELLRHFEGV